MLVLREFLLTLCRHPDNSLYKMLKPRVVDKMTIKTVLHEVLR